MYKKENLKGYLYITPAFILLGLIVVFPIIYTFYISLTNMNIYHWFDFKVIGLENYKRALFVFNSGFLKALFLTVIWTIVNMVLQLVIAYLVATLLNSKLLKISKSIYRTLLIIPWAIPGYISILVWKTGMYNVEFGLFNQWLAIIGINKVEWLNYPFLAFISMTVVNLWLALPFMTIIMDGAFQSIDNAYYEVADIEGANFFQKSIYITIPLIKKIIGPAVIITMFTTFKQFDIFYLMTLQPSSRTGAGLQTIITFAYENAFITNNYGFSAAVSMIVFIMLILITLFTTNDFRRNRNEKRSKNNIKKILLHSFFILFIFITLIPVLYTLSISFSVNSNVVSDNFSFIPKPFTFENYINLLTKTDLLIWFKNTIILSVFTLLLALFVGIPAAYAFSRKSFKGSKLLQKSLIMLNAFPAILSMFAIWYLMSGPLYLVNTYIGLIIIYAGTMTIFTVINMKGYFDSIPKEIEEAARIDGANEWQIIIKVLLPLAKPAIVVTSIMILIFVWNEYLFSTTFMIGADKYTLAAGLYSLQAGEISGSWSLFSAAATLISFPILIVFLSIQKHLRSGLTVGGVKD